MEGLSTFRLLMIAGLCCACGSKNEIPSGKSLSAENVQSFLGLTPGSCFAYGFKDPDTNEPVTRFVQIEGPNTAVIAGKTVLIQSRRAPNNNFAELREYLDVETEPGKVKLLWSQKLGGNIAQGGYITKKYPNDEAPVLLSVQKQSSGEFVFNSEGWNTKTKPQVCGADCKTGTEESFSGQVLSSTERVGLPSGSSFVETVGVKIQFETSEDGSSKLVEQSIYVPNLGLAQKSTNNQRICGAIVCDINGKNCIKSGVYENTSCENNSVRCN